MQVGIQRVVGEHVDPAPESRLELVAEGEKVRIATTRTEVDEQIEIAVGSRRTARHGAEQARGLHAVLARHTQHLGRRSGGETEAVRVGNHVSRIDHPAARHSRAPNPPTKTASPTSPAGRGASRFATLGGVALAGLGVLVAIPTWLRWRSEEFLVTDRRVIQLEGVLAKRALDSNLGKVNDVRLS